jgi:hypothetical protein
LTFDSGLFVEKSRAMEELNVDYAAFEHAMDDLLLYRDLSMSFEDICRAVGADPAVVEAILVEELGYRGEELVERYRGFELQEE